MKLVYPNSQSNIDLTLPDLTGYFWMSFAFTIAIILVEANIFTNMSPLISSWIQFILTTIIVTWCGRPLLKKGWLSIKNHRLNMFTQISFGLLVTYGYGLGIVCFSELFPHIFNPNIPAAYFLKAAAIITTLSLLELIFENRIQNKFELELQNNKNTFFKLLCHYFISVIFIVAILAFVFSYDKNNGLISAVSLILITCASGISLSIPLVYKVAIKRAQDAGINIDNTMTLNQLKKTTILIIDKSCALQSSASLALNFLRKKGINIVLMTNDNLKDATIIADTVGITTIASADSNEEKRSAINGLQKQGFVVATATTHNDSRVEINMYQDHQDVMIKLTTNDLLGVAQIYKLSYKVSHNIKENIWLTLAYNSIFIPLAAGLYYHWTGFPFNPTIAVSLMLTFVFFIIKHSLTIEKFDLTITR